jgi:hypothetical protein
LLGWVVVDSDIQSDSVGQVNNKMRKSLARVSDIHPTDSPELPVIPNAVGFAERSVVDQFLELLSAQGTAHGFLHDGIFAASPNIEYGELVLHCNG